MKLIEWINQQIKEIENQTLQIKNIAMSVTENYLLEEYIKEKIKQELFSSAYNVKTTFLNKLLSYKEKIDKKIYFHQTPVKIVVLRSENIHKNINSLININAFMNESTLFTLVNEDSFNRNIIYIFSRPVDSQEIKCIQFAISNIHRYHTGTTFNYAVDAYEWTGEDLVSVNINQDCPAKDIIELKKD